MIVELAIEVRDLGRRRSTIQSVLDLHFMLILEIGVRGRTSLMFTPRSRADLIRPIVASYAVRTDHIMHQMTL